MHVLQTFKPLWNNAGKYCKQPLHRVSKNVPPIACYNFDTHEQILIFLEEMLRIK